ncbi:MAG: DUF4175 family protein [Polyangiales bacterium]
MGAENPGEPAEAVARYVRVLRARASVLYAVRAACAALGVASIGFVLAGVSCGPVVEPWLTHIALGALAALTGGMLAFGLRPLLGLRGLGSCELVSQRDPTLGSLVRSALELRSAAHGSSALIAAHARDAREALRALPAARVVPLRMLGNRAVIVGLGCAALSAALWLTSDAARVGAEALLHPARLRDGVRVAPVVAKLEARLVFPSYLAAEPRVLRDPTTIEAPRGTTVELTVVPRLSSQGGTLALGDASTRLSAAPGGRLFGRFVVRQSASLGLRLYADDVAYEDNRARAVRALPDRAPDVTVQPPAVTTVEARDRVPLPWRAKDDHGLASVELAARLEDGPEQRRRLWSALSSDKPAREVSAATSISPAELGAGPGDTLLIWLEARDGDVVSGPNVGESQLIRLQIASDSQRFSLQLPQLREVLDRALGALADRLETSLPERPELAAQRFEELRESSEGWLGKLHELVTASRQRDESTSLDLESLQSVLDRARRELARELALYRGGTHTHKQRAEADGRMLAEQERDVLLLADLLAQGLVDESRDLTRELSDLKRHIGELLAQLKAHDSAEAQRAVLAEIAKAQRRLRELAESLSRLSNQVPSEFINREALPSSEAGDALAELRKAVEAGDIDAAQQKLEALGREIDELAQHIEKGGARFREAHFGPRDQALADAEHKVSMLAAEQGRLADRTHELVKHAAERAKARNAAHGPSSEMQRTADELERELQSLAGSEQNGPEAPWLDRAHARMRDAADAMRTSDMAEARAMSSAAQTSLEQAASGLEQEARMSANRGDEANRHLRASAANDKLRRLQSQIDQTMPQLGQFMGEPERQQMRGDSEAQGQARRQAEALQGQMAKGPDGDSLSPDGERGLEQVGEAMRRAEGALQRGDPQASSLAQRDASERLHELQERLARKRGQEQPGSDGRRSSRREGEGGGPRFDGPVHIPGADEFQGPVQMRRRLLDAMREPPPSEYKSAVARYYEELLR